MKMFSDIRLRYDMPKSVVIVSINLDRGMVHFENDYHIEEISHKDLLKLGLSGASAVYEYLRFLDLGPREIDRVLMDLNIIMQGVEFAQQSRG